MQGTSFDIAPISDHAFFEQAQLKCLFGGDSFLAARITAQALHLVGIGFPNGIASQALFSSFKIFFDQL
jgi:hypothetical protein